MKITRNTTVEQLKGFLNTNFKAVQKADKSLADSISYASQMAKKDPKSVKKADLADLAKQVIEVLGDKVREFTPQQTATVAVAENSVKPKLSAKKSADKAETPKTEDKTTTASETAGESKDEKKQTAPKAEKKVSAKKKEDVATELATASSFPDTLKAGDSEYTLAHDIKSIKDLLDAFNNEEEFVFAFIWTTRHLKQFPYANGELKAPKKFDNDLDLASTLYVSDEGKVSYHLSMYTEALYQVMPEAFEEVEGVRYSNGIEFQIYRLVK